jgi:hypothetical protein
MSNMEDFIKRNTPKIRQFYRNLLVKFFIQSFLNALFLVMMNKFFLFPLI